jgi:hypothetical protein
MAWVSLYGFTNQVMSEFSKVFKITHLKNNFLLWNKFLGGIMQLWLMVSGVWNDFGLQMDLDPPLEGRLQEVEEEDNFSFRFYF